MLVVERSLVFLYTAIHTMMLPPRDRIFSAIIKPDSTMVKATLRDGRSAILFGVLSLLLQLLLFFLFFSVDETNVYPKLASNVLGWNESMLVPTNFWGNLRSIGFPKRKVLTIAANQKREGLLLIISFKILGQLEERLTHRWCSTW